MTLFEELKERGLIFQSTDEARLQDALDNKKLTVYLGIDPTGDSIHIGHLTVYMILAHLKRAGHKVVALVGGGTAMIGDPSGKAEDRVQMDRSVIEDNTARLQDQINQLVEIDQMVDNYDWLSKLELVPFLRDIGSKFRVNEMIKAEGYKQRLDRESGLSFLEFSYQLMQAYDYLRLNEDYNCNMQIGGSDQWGNIVSGVSLIRRVNGEEVYAFTAPLLTTADGKKMGKTEGGAVWIDPDKTTPYEFYQYWINVDDADVEKFLKIFTFLDLAEIEELSQLKGADIRQAKEKLAFEVARFVHGEESAQKARETSGGVFGEGGSTDELPTVEISIGDGMNVLDVLVEAQAVGSKSEARRLLEQGGVYVNEESVDGERTITPEDFKEGELILRIGKKKYHKVILK